MLQCLVFAARRKGRDLSVGRLVHEHSLSAEEVDLARLAEIAEAHGFKAKAADLDWDRLSRMTEMLPVVLALDNGRGVVLVGLDAAEGQRKASLVDPLADRPGIIRMPWDTLTERWSGLALVLKSRPEFDAAAEPFGLSWFIPELLREKAGLSQVVLASLVLPLVALAVPLFFQLVIDKVLVHQNLATLYVLIVGVVLALLFEAAFGLLRQYFLLFASRRIDIRMAQRTFGHLLSLPLAFFEQRYAGVLAKHMQQTDKIRKFLTGRMLLLVLDLLVLVVLLPILFVYSAKLTWVVLAFTGLIAGIIGLLVRPFKRRLHQLYAAEGDRQALLVESIHGMGTVKALALEPDRSRQWDDKAALAVQRHYRVGLISSTAQNITKLLQQLMTVTVVAWGAMEVFGGGFTVGALVAFQMLAGRVTGPLVSMVSLIHEYQETALSVRMLGEVMNAQPERPPLSAGLRPAIRGGLAFEGVGFTYQGSSLPALAEVSFRTEPGTVLGVVGKSGSGKSTLAKLIQGLYQPQEGLIRLDGIDLRELDFSHLRRNIGVVPQDAFLFRGTIRENIAMAAPDAGPERVAEAARLAGADEFIERLPQGLDTRLEEGGVNLSGGQRQRLAIARALISRPPILILDEATSALDPESEAIIKDNLRTIAKGRTVVLISHRLTNLVDADSILVLDQGRLACQGDHGALLEECPIYAALWRKQVAAS